MNMISVVIPVYNAEKYLHQCIDSVLHQTYQNIELILVDDGSTDSSSELCRKYQEKDDRIRYIYQENGGVSSARNAGLEIARGEYIVFVDSDDLIKEDMLFELLPHENNTDFTMCGYELYDDDSGVILQQYRCNKLCGSINNLAGCISEYVTPPFLLSPCFKMFKNNIIRMHNLKFPPNLSYGEDAMFVFQYLMHCAEIEIRDYIGYVYRKHGNATLSTKFVLEKIDINFQINQLIIAFLKHTNSNNYEEFFAKRLLDNFVSYTKELVVSNLTFSQKRVVFYQKYVAYKKYFSKPKRLSQKIVVLAGMVKLCYSMVYIFKLKK